MLSSLRAVQYLNNQRTVRWLSNFEIICSNLIFAFSNAFWTKEMHFFYPIGMPKALSSSFTSIRFPFLVEYFSIACFIFLSMSCFFC